MLPSCCYGFAGGSLLGLSSSYPVPNGSGTNQTSSPALLSQSSKMELLPLILRTQLKGSPEGASGLRTRSAHRTAFYPEMIYSPSEKPREPPERGRIPSD